MLPRALCRARALRRAARPLLLRGDEGALGVKQREAQVHRRDGLADDGWYFASDRMRVKHDNDYINDDGYEDRLAESAEQVDVAEACA